MLFTQRVCPGELVLARLVSKRRAAARPYGFKESDTDTELVVETALAGSFRGGIVANGPFSSKKQ